MGRNMKWLMIAAILFYRLVTNMPKSIEELFQIFRMVNKYSMQCFRNHHFYNMAFLLSFGHTVKIAYYYPKYPKMGKTILGNWIRHFTSVWVKLPEF